MLAKTIRDLDSILLENIPQTQALRSSIGSNLFPIYIRNQDEGLSGKEASLNFSYNGQGLNFQIALNDEIVTDGSLELDDKQIISLLSSKLIPINYKQIDTPRKIQLESILGFVVKNKIEFTSEELTYLGNGVFLPQSIIDIVKAVNLDKKQVKVEKVEPKESDITLDRTLGYYPIRSNDPEAIRVAKFFANLEIEGFYKEGNLRFGKEEDKVIVKVNETLNAQQSKKAMPNASSSVNARFREVKTLIPQPERRDIYTPIVPLYNERLIEGRGFAIKENVLKALFIDNNELELMFSQGKLEKKWDSIIKRNVMDEQIRLYGEVWNWLQENNYQVPKLSESQEPVQEKQVEMPVRVNHNKLVLEGKKFSSVATRVSGNNYSMPIVIAGKNMPSSKLARLSLRNNILELYTDNGLINRFRYSDDGLTNYDTLNISYISSSSSSNITIENIIGVNTRGNDELAIIGTERPRAKVKVPEPVRVELKTGSVEPKEVGTLEDGGVKVPELVEPKAAPPPEKVVPQVVDTRVIKGRRELCAELGVPEHVFGSATRYLAEKGLVHRDEKNVLFIYGKDIATLRAELVPYVEKASIQPLPLRDIQQNNHYDLTKHVLLKFMAKDMVPYYKGESKNVHGYILGVSKGTLPFVLEEKIPNQDRTFLYLEKKYIGIIVDLFRKHKDFTLEDKIAKSIVNFYSLEGVPRDPSSDYTKIDFILTRQGILESSKEFYLARYHIAEKLKDKIKLEDGKFPIISLEHQTELYEVLGNYLGKKIEPAGRQGPNGPQPSRGTSTTSRSPVQRAPPREGDSTLSVLTGIEKMAIDGTLTYQMHKGGFWAKVKKALPLDQRYMDPLYHYANSICEAMLEKGDVGLDKALGLLKSKLRVDDDESIRIASDKLKFIDSKISKSDLSIYIKREEYLSSQRPRIYL